MDRNDTQRPLLTVEIFPAHDPHGEPTMALKIRGPVWEPSDSLLSMGVNLQLVYASLISTMAGYRSEPGYDAARLKESLGKAYASIEQQLAASGNVGVN